MVSYVKSEYQYLELGLVQETRDKRQGREMMLQGVMIVMKRHDG